MLLTDISPRAAKLYLALSTLSPPHANPPTARIPLTSLARIVNLSPRSCAYALRELQTLKLITRLPRRAAAPCAYQIAPFPYTHPAACSPTNLQPAAPAAHHNLQPVAPTPAPYLHSVAGVSEPDPIPASKTHNLQPAAAIKPKRPTGATATPEDDPLLNPALLQFLMNSLSDTEKAAIIAPLEPLLATLTKSAPHPSSTSPASEPRP